MLRVSVPHQRYEWGVLGADSPSVATLAALNTGAPVEADAPYAELWMGTHAGGPATTKEGTTLKEFLGRNAKLMGEALTKRFPECANGDLPFLFKVLSIRKALSIQAHPDKKLAEKLHAEKPDMYKDPNHKPEMTVALTKFRALCQFIPKEEVASVFHEITELKTVVGLQAYESFYEGAVDPDRFDEQFQTMLKTVLLTKDLTLKEVVKEALKRIGGIPEDKRTVKQALFLELNEQYPNDVGVLTALFLNVVTLEPGEAIVLAAGEPHAYLEGECVECMATSDNVVRAGLTPKPKDVSTLIDMLTYNFAKPNIMRPAMDDTGMMRVYNPGKAFDEFEVREVIVPVGGAYELTPLETAAILLVFGGEASATVGAPEDMELVPDDNEKGQYANTNLDVTQGEVYFIAAKVGAVFEQSGSGPFRAFIASVNSTVY